MNNSKLVNAVSQSEKFPRKLNIEHSTLIINDFVVKAFRGAK